MARKVASQLFRSAVFAVIAGVGFIIVHAVADGRPGWSEDILLLGGIAAWGVANLVDRTVFEEDTIPVRVANENLARLGNTYIEQSKARWEDFEKARKDFERLAYLRGVNDAALHPERVRQVIADLKAEGEGD
jgi:hypothetical protein